MKVIFRSQLFKNLLTGMFLIQLLFISRNIFSQDFISKKNGAWKSNSTWQSATSCSQWDNLSQGQPPISKNWGCAINVTINHEVTYNGNASGFGSGVFSSLHIGPNGKLIFDSDIVINGGGSVPTITLAEGAELIVNGKFTIDRAVTIIVPENAKMIIQNFDIGNNRPEITIEEGGLLLVNNETEMSSNSTLNVDGKFQTVELVYSSGGTINIGSAVASGEVSVSGDLDVGNGELNIFNTSTILVDGSSTTGHSGSIYMKGNANGRFLGDVDMGYGGSMTLEENAIFSFEADFHTSGGAKIRMENNSKGTVHKDIIMTNGTIELNTYSEIMVGGKLLASGGARIEGNNNGAMFICDYANSTKENTYHVSLNGNAYYGMGCFVLPVVWKSFEVDVLKENVSELVWKTASEEGNSHFEIERSVGGIGNFEKIGQINASGWTNTESKYTFKDDQLNQLVGMVYYRIRQVDYDGNQMVSDVVSVKASGKPSNQEPMTWTAYPNPTDGSGLKIKLSSGNFTGPVSIRFMQASSVTNFEGEAGMELDQWLNAVASTAVKGVGVLEVFYQGEVYRIKIMKI